MTTNTRTVITRSGSRPRGWFSSLKNHSLIEWESLLELDFLRIAEFLYWVTRFRAYQQLIVVHHDQGSFKAFPDFAMSAVDGHDEEIIEVKSDRDLLDRETQARLDLIRGHYQQRGTRYTVWSESEIRREPRITNAKLLIGYRRPGCRQRLLAQPRCRDILRVRGDISLGDVSKHVNSSKTAYELLANDLLACDFNARISPTSSVRVH
jgi:hypothetical protein